jgi:hypothetical protein
MVIVDAIKPKIKEEYSRWHLYRSLYGFPEPMLLLGRE